MAKELLPQLKSGKIIPGWLGVMIQDVTPDLAASFGLKQPKGALTADVVKDSPAEKARLKRRDVVVRLNGTEVKHAHTLSRHVAGTAPDTEVTMDIIRDRKEKAVKVRFGTMAQEQEEPTPQSDPST